MNTIRIVDRYVADRDEESGEIIQDLQSSCRGQIWIIEGHSAIGKSFLTKKIVERCAESLPNLTPIIVKTAPNNSDRSLVEGKYLRDVFTQVRYVLKEVDGVSFASFVRQANKKQNGKSLFGDAVDAFAEEGQFFARDLAINLQGHVHEHLAKLALVLYQVFR